MKTIMLKQLKSISKRPVHFSLFVFGIQICVFCMSLKASPIILRFFHFLSDIWKDHKIMEHCLLGIKTNGFIVLTCRYKEAGFSLN